MSPAAFHHFASSYLALQKVGFELLTCLKPVAMQNIDCWIALLVNRTTFDAAVITAMSPAGRSQLFVYVEIMRRYRDSSVVQTNNASILSVFPEPIRRTTYQLPAVNDPAQLFHLHQLLIATRPVNSEPYSRLDEEFGGDPVAAMQSYFAETINELIRRGFVYQPSSADHVRCTMYGALFAGWSQLWPISLLRRIRRDRVARQLVHEAISSIPIAELN